MIHLSVGHLVVDWGKNTYFKDHSALFQDRDLKPVPSYYAGDNWPQGDTVVELNEGFGKPLGHVVDRVELLGYTMRTVEHHYSVLHRLDDPDDEEPIPFEQLRKALKKVEISKFSGKYRDDYKAGGFLRKKTLKALWQSSCSPFWGQALARADRPDK